MAAMLKVISDFGSARVWPLDPKMFTGVDFKPPRQTNDVVLQIIEDEEQSTGVGLTSRSETSIVVPHDGCTAGSQAEPHNLSSD